MIDVPQLFVLHLHIRLGVLLLLLLFAHDFKKIHIINKGPVRDATYHNNEKILSGQHSQTEEENLKMLPFLFSNLTYFAYICFTNLF